MALLGHGISVERADQDLANDERAPRKVIDVEINSAVRSTCARGERRRVGASFAAKRAGSRKISTEGPAPLRAAPENAILPF